MAVAVEAFKVVTEFVFDAALAEAEVGSLQRRVQGLSDVADQAIATVRSLGINFALQFSGAGGGIIGLLGGAITAADQFKNSQLGFTNIFSANMEHLTGNIENFNDQMRVSRVILNDISRDALKFGLPAKQLEGFTKNLAAFLIPKGLAGQNLKAARDISRNLLKAAPILGIDPTFAGNQLIRAIEGQAGINNPVFRRLLAEAPEPFQAAGVTTARQFNVLEVTKRFNILNTAISKFSSNTQVLTARANTLSGIFQRVTNLFSGISSVLKPLGDVLLPPLIEIMNIGIDLIQTKGAKLVEEFARFIEPFLREPKRLILGLLQISSLAEDVASAASIAGIVLLLIHMQELFIFIKGIPFIGAAVASMGALIARSKILTFIMNILTAAGVRLATFFGGSLLAVLGKMSLLFGGLIIIFQAISRALEIAKFNRLVDFINDSTKIAAAITDIKESFFNIIQPIQDVIEGIALILANTILDTSAATGGLTSLLTILADAMTGIGFVVNAVLSTMRSGIAAILSMIVNVPVMISNVADKLAAFDFSGAVDAAAIGFQNIGTDAAEEFNKSFNRNISRIGAEGEEGKGAAVVNNVTNIGKIDINNSFKETVQPDRIAFTIKDQIMKAAQNPTQARGRTLTGAFAR